jgi:predicted esterase
MQAINAENTMGKNAPKIPVYIWSETNDELMPIADANALAKTYCANGVKLQYRRIATDHVLGALQLSSSGMSYVVDRFNGKAAPTTCN